MVSSVLFPIGSEAFVSSTTTEPLTTVSNTVRMYAYFSLNEKEFLALTKGLEGKSLQEKFKNLPDVSLVLADNSVYERPEGSKLPVGWLISKPDR